ncbi:beta-ketoacyl synthase N-terminal-like domain-containing protein [Acanthopleuribacter pedis]|uniref:Ketosynthase family 3 (KS3) domain-containing protein n=1 Tax=Acanthopleuribacter pedis TaxID=442870 RepID=A0A8J7Q6G5_9BACT|nr:beta-ketoacyl synthase N-terminal-like domain-containing protein [Acanthopleuribacter pedis]MBO1319021.1 hypothetical protein [Acanthopleuribacter pedis]
MSFSPIAVIGASCVLPGALSPQQLWEQVAAGRDLLQSAPAERWRVPFSRLACAPDADNRDRTWSDRGGYVTGFDQTFDPHGLNLNPDLIQQADPLVHWLLHCGREALGGRRTAGQRAGAVFGNLGFPTEGMVNQAIAHWLGQQGDAWQNPALRAKLGVDPGFPINRFMSGLPAELLARGLNLDQGAFALDAACASSLYAIKYACDMLNDGRADVMLAGGVNRSDDLFIHMGFCALGALSKTGRSRPFHAEADGLLPAEGCALVALKRLEDAVRDGDPIQGVIRGVGLSNDGRSRGLLVPAADGQVQAVQAAWRQAELPLDSVDLFECHATGTTVGDATELQSMTRVFGEALRGRDSVPLGSLKSNMGHLITVAGAAALIKVLGAFAHEQLPPTLHAAEAPNTALAETPFRLQNELTAWRGERPMRAGVSAFGFGGNNAHMIVDQYEPGHAPRVFVPAAPLGDIVVVATGVRVGELDTAAFSDCVFGGETALQSDADGRVAAPARDIELSLRGLKFPPRDLEQTLGQQNMLLQVARQTLEPLDLPRSTSLFVGMGADNQIARYGLRWSLEEWAARMDRDAAWLETARESVLPSLTAAGVLGTMPNIPANRLNSQFDFRGPSFTVAREALSGLTALQLAARALRAGETDAAVVAAVDLATESGNQSAAAALGRNSAPADAAVVLVLKRKTDALAAGDSILAELADQQRPGIAALHFGPESEGTGYDVSRVVGDAHAASGLVHAAAAVLSCAFGLEPRRGEVAGRWSDARLARVSETGLYGAATETYFLNAGAPLRPDSLPEPATPLAPTLNLAAHPSDIQLPLPEKIDMTQSHTPQTMAAAPWLPPVTEINSHASVAPQPVPVQPQAPAPAVATAVPVTPVAAVPVVQAPVAEPAAVWNAELPEVLNDGVGDALRLWHQTMSNAHQQYLQQQQQVHHQFLAMRNQAARALVEMGTGQVEAGYGDDWGGSAPEQTPSPVFEPTPPVPAAPVVQTPPVAKPVAAAPPAPKPAPKPAPVAAKASASTQAKPVAPKAAPVAPKANVPAPAKAAPVTTAAKPANTPDGWQPADANPRFDKHQPEALPGLKCSRADLEVLASGRISDIFGPAFAGQDGYHRQVRMPEPPLLLADRVTGIDAEAKSMGKGTIWTETDVSADSWYLHMGRMPAGVFIESGQADLLLISWLGIDFHNQSDRIYRLLGCDLTYHGPLPAVGETLRYDIHVYGHAKHGETRLMFFKYDCHDREGNLRMSVRNGQAGFFSDAELADSAGILWTPEEGDHTDSPRLDAPVVGEIAPAFDQARLRAWADQGDLFRCMGPGFEWAQTHNRTPNIQGGPMLFLDQIDVLDRKGGPWKRGYLHATQHITPEHWFFEGHFKNDPCMPGTLMFEGCLQAMAFYLASLGYTLDKDGWRFEPVQGETIEMRCRGQVTPTSKVLTYELYIEEVIDGPYPTLYADLLCTADGLKAFHARRCGLRLVPDWPLTTQPAALTEDHSGRPFATVDGFKLDYASLLACAWGKPSDAFGPMYRRFDQGKVPRLPGPPYHFMSRIAHVEGKMGGMEVGSAVTVEYDIPDSVWYFDENAWPTMPFAVLLEAALQPCGWLASYIGSALTTEQDLYFRNLDGDGKLHNELLPGGDPLVTHTRLTNISKAAGMIIVSFDVRCTQAEREIYTLKTVFGFFPAEALANQVGLPATKTRAEAVAEPSDFLVDFKPGNTPYQEGSPCLPAPMLLMLDRVTGFWPEGGKKGLGKMRGEKDVDPAEWFFKAHFFQDPVQPGSLGLEALIQLLQFYMLETGMHQGERPLRFEPLALGHDMIWHYRGQVVPKNKMITTEIEIIEQGVDAEGNPYAVAEGFLWCDGRCIYGTEKMGMRLVPDEGRPKGPGHDTDESFVIDPDQDTWLFDHRPTWTLPAVPMMSMADYLAQAVEARTNQPVVALQDLQVFRWLTLSGPTQVKIELEEGDDAWTTATLSAWRQAPKAELSRFEKVATARLRSGPYAEAPAYEPLVLADDATDADPYGEGILFHGPAFQIMTGLKQDHRGAVADLDADLDTVPRGAIHPLLLDGVTHMMPHDTLYRWSDKIENDWIAYPHRLEHAEFFGPAPKGSVRCEVLFAGFADEGRLPRFQAKFIADGRVWCALEFVEILLPKGPIGHQPPLARRAFLRDRKAGTGVALSRVGAEETTLEVAELRANDWLPGTVATIYRADEAQGELAMQVAVKDHFAALFERHPDQIRIDAARQQVWAARRPMQRWAYQLEKEGTTFRVRHQGEARTDFGEMRDFWRKWSGLPHWPLEDMYVGLAEQFAGDVYLEDALAFEQLRGKPALFLANHQVGVESVVFTLIVSALTGLPSGTLAKAEHRQSWIGKLREFHLAWPGAFDPRTMVFFEREDPAAMPELLKSWVGAFETDPRNLTAHVEGTRSLHARKPVTRLSAAFIDLAIACQIPLVPVRFVGGLPVEPVEKRLEFPLGFGRQDIVFGRPIHPASLASLPFKERKEAVVEALNQIGPPLEKETACVPNESLAAEIRDWVAKYGVSEPAATVAVCLQRVAEPCAASVRLIEAMRQGVPAFGDLDPDPWSANVYRWFTEA